MQWDALDDLGKSRSWFNDFIGTIIGKSSQHAIEEYEGGICVLVMQVFYLL